MLKVHLKPTKEVIPRMTPCGKLDGHTPDTWLLWSCDEYSITCPECKKIVDKENSLLYTD